MKRDYNPSQKRLKTLKRERQILEKRNNMKKYVLILFTAISFGQASNQMVSFTAAQSLGFALKAGQSHVTSNQCMTKSEALAKYNLDASAMNSYASNQLVPKSAWVSGITGVSLQIVKDENLTWATICSASWTNPMTKYTISGLTIGQSIYNDVGCTLLWDHISEYSHFNEYSFKVLDGGVYKKIGLDLRNDGLVQAIENCSTADTTPPTPPNYVSASENISYVEIFWNGATDNVGITEYYIYRNGGYVGSTGTETSYIDYGACSGTYYYQVQAVDAAGNVSLLSNNSNTVQMFGECQ
ncbi:hypothetical protein [Flavobacterium sp. ZB4P13]|uniref:hypothetical protein n=1 Tax=Flavobacterium sp. ZB4P13 TaxID=3401728 RepID=UPI003AAEDABD